MCCIWCINVYQIYNIYHPQSPIYNVLSHDDVMTWKCFPHYLPFVRRIHRLPLTMGHSRHEDEIDETYNKYNIENLA